MTRRTQPVIVMAVRRAKRGYIFKIEGIEYEVMGRCGVVRDLGSWICASHGVELPSTDDLALLLKIDGEHIVVWKCAEHGPEIP